MTPGLTALVAAVAAAVAAGLAWQRASGRMRRPAGAAAVAAPGGPAGTAGPGGGAGAGRGQLVTGEMLGGDLGPRATLVQFSTAFCAPCRATRRVLAEVAAMVPGVAHVEVDAESRLDLVRALHVLRTPTVLVLGPDGAVVRRASGQPRKADVIAAVGAAVGEEPGDLGGAEPDNSYLHNLDNDSDSSPSRA